VARADGLRGLLGGLRGVLDAVDDFAQVLDDFDPERDLGDLFEGLGAEPPGAARAARREALVTLGLEPDQVPTEAEIRAAYKGAARRAHPDMGGSSAAFARVAAARDLLLSEV